MKKTFVAIAVGLAASTSAFANNMYINLPNNSYDPGATIYGQFGIGDANTQTGLFNEFSFNQMLATSIYDLSDGSVFGSFYDTNLPGELNNLGVPTSGLAMDGLTTVTLALPTPAQSDLDALSPLVPPLSADGEGFLATWQLKVAYHFDGVLGTGGPNYTGGSFDVYFDDITNNANDRLVLSGELMSSQLQPANLNLFFDITFAEDNFLFIQDPLGYFKDANDLMGNVDPFELVLNTNVNPPIPTPDQLLMVFDDNNNGLPAAVRQSTLNGGITSKIPEPGTMALMGLGLLGLGLARRRKA